jgi:hypothetical protein
MLEYNPDILAKANIGISNILKTHGFTPIFDSRLLAVPREGQIAKLDVEDLLMSYRQGTRRDIRYSLKSNLTVVRVDSLALLQSAYTLLKENATEHNYPLRPWETFKAALWPCVQHDRAIVLLAEYGAERLATIVVLFGGTRAYYTMGGTRRINIDKIYPAHLLQYIAMQETLKRGYFQYDLTSIVEGGVADFKRGFRPTYYRLIDPLSKVFKPNMFRLYQALYPRLRRNKHRIAKVLHGVRSLMGKK